MLVVNKLARIFFHVDFVDAHKFLLALHLNFNFAIAANWVVELAYLIILWIVWIEIILAIEFAILSDGTVCGKTNCNGLFHHLPVKHRKGTWHTGTNWTCVSVRGAAKCCATAAENLCLCGKLHMNLKADDCFVCFAHFTCPPLLQLVPHIHEFARMHMQPELLPSRSMRRQPFARQLACRFCLCHMEGRCLEGPPG